MVMSNKRKERDIMKLLMSNYEVTIDSENRNEFYVMFQGPKDSTYEGGTWKIHVLLPDQYPYKSPSIGFTNKVYHPNVDEASGTVCLDVINQTWSPMYELINIFDVFLPQLLLYPNPTDPLNGEAASLLTKHPEKFKEKVKEYIRKYATPAKTEDESSKKKENVSKKNDRLKQGQSSKGDENEICGEEEEGNESEHSELSNASLEEEVDV